MSISALVRVLIITDFLGDSMGISPLPIILVLLLGVLIFGKDLPEVARQVGSGLMEFRKGLNELKSVAKVVTTETSLESDRESSSEFSEETDKHEMSGIKFDPPDTLSPDDTIIVDK